MDTKGRRIFVRAKIAAEDRFGRSMTKDVRNRPGESRLGERRTNDWLSHDLPEVPEAIQNPLLPSIPVELSRHTDRERVSLLLFPSTHDF